MFGYVSVYAYVYNTPLKQNHKADRLFKKKIEDSSNL